MSSAVSAARVGWGAVACVLAMALAFSPASLRQPTAAAGIPNVAVVDFYAISPAAGAAGILPERFAADDLSAMLARAGAGRITVVPRQDVRQAQRELGWTTADVLRFARMSALAQRVHADRLAVGWIRELAAQRDAGEGAGVQPRGAAGGTFASAAVHVQVFDAAQGRIIGGAEFRGYAPWRSGPATTMRDVLHRTLEPAVAPTLASLTGIP